MDEIRIGDLISLDGRTCTVRGFDPMSLPEQTVELVDTVTGESVRVAVVRLVSAKSAASARAVRRGRIWRW